ncbi:MAG: sigma-54-dependent Fis family transcriptional regulator [Candidatus Marinimicrobia bacterium]|nr:sigma-54-dependent Fis family transcriptional regulator [Candidatus Neomarinimicrobiota bacterium]
MNTNESIKILVIEDDSTMCDGMVTVLRKEGYRVNVARDGAAGSRLFRKERPDLVLTDLKLPEKSGMQLLNEFKATDPDLPVILISAFGTIDLAVNALKSGAYDFIPKPFSVDELKNKVALALKMKLMTVVDDRTEDSFYGLIGTSAMMQKVFEKISQVAKVDSPVLITGESGTGKELVARAIHAESSRRRRHFLAVNCGALTDTLLESELFGHEKGAFTGAIRQHAGIFEQADGGTILLDEIGEISVAMQVKLLRVIQRQVFQRVGGANEVTTDVRVIAATNKDLKTAIKDKTFREDLFFRLNVLPLRLPPLRERSGDIKDLIDHIVHKKCAELGREVPAFDDHALEMLENYPWPGNIRELENFLERLLIFSKDARIEPTAICLDEPDETFSTVSGKLTDVLEETEILMIKRALQETGGIKQRAARLLGIKTSTLYYKMDKYDIAAGESGSES